jgi:hypothetical protein
MECKIAASGNLMPYLYSKLGAITPQRFIETKIAVPDFQSIDDVEKFINHIARHVARGSLSFEHGKELADLARVWVTTHYADDELRIKLASASALDPSKALKIIIEGGLLSLPGCNISLAQLNGHQLELDAVATPTLPAQDPTIGHPDPPASPLHLTPVRAWVKNDKGEWVIGAYDPSNAKM